MQGIDGASDLSCRPKCDALEEATASGVFMIFSDSIDQLDCSVKSYRRHAIIVELDVHKAISQCRGVRAVQQSLFCQ